MRSFLILSVGAVALVSTPAAARDGAWYVGGDFGAMIVEDTHIDTATTKNAVTLDHNYGFDGALFVGYDLGSFRIEAEGGYKTAGLDKFDNSIPIPSDTGPHPVGVHDAHGDVSALSFMVNGMLDFGDEDGISGFVGGGVGVARVNFNNLRAFSNSGEFLDDKDSRFAWQIVAGVRHSIGDNIDVTLKYRFFNVNDLRLEPFGGGRVDSALRTHSLLGGITFNFGGTATAH